MKKILLSLMFVIMFISLVNAVTNAQDIIFPTYQTLVSGGTADSIGIKIIPNQTVVLTSVNTLCTTGFSMVFLKNSAGTQIANATISGNTATFTTTPKLYMGEKYIIDTLDTSTATHYYNITNLPKNTSVFTVVNGSISSADYGSLYCIDKINYAIYETSTIPDLKNSIHECSYSSSNKFLTIVGKNESASMESSNLKINDFLLNYRINGLSTINTYTFSSATDSATYYFCYNSSVDTLASNVTITYLNQFSPQRSYYENFTLNATNTNRSLYTLVTPVGLYTSFQVVDGAFTPIQGALVVINRTGYGVVGAAFTDGSGLATFFLDPTQSYTIGATYTGYSVFSTTLSPTQSSYTINLGTGTLSALSTVVNYNEGISYTINPATNYLINNTSYKFNVTLSSSVYALDEFGISLLNNSNQVIANSSNSSSSGGFAQITASTGSNKLVKLNIFWRINNTYTNVTRIYYVSNTDGTGYSLKNFKNRIISYMENESDSDGLFGLKKTDNLNFNLNIIVFFIIFLFAGVFSFKYGFSSPSSIMLFILIAVWFFEVTTELIDVAPNSTVPFLSIISALVFFITFVREVQ